MRRTLTRAALVVLLGGGSLGARGADAPADAAITQVLDREAEAFRKGDLAGVTACWETEDTSSVIESGLANWGWADYRDHHLKHELAGMKITDHKRSNLRVVAGADMALATFEFRIQGTYEERAFDMAVMESVVLRRRDGVWRIVHVHASAPPKKLVAPGKHEQKR